MAPIPSDVREALGLGESDVPWVRLRSSLGSIVGETFLLAGEGVARVAMRSSALADLEELKLDAAPRYEEDANDAAIVVVRGAKEERLAVGYLERDAVRDFFAGLASALEAGRRAEEAPPPASPRPSEDDATDAARARLLATLGAAAGRATLEATRARLLGALESRAQHRRIELATRRAAAAAEHDPVAVRARAEKAIKEIVGSVAQLDDRIGKLRKKRQAFGDPAALALFDEAIEDARKKLAAKTREIKKERKEKAAAVDASRRTPWGLYVFFALAAAIVAWVLAK
ncbi:MAG TPA: hypothetical protein VL400_22415 [Polyangiaceae bacterium]|nr:hypothetical protein [Polyangiaceae bacterium]